MGHTMKPDSWARMAVWYDAKQGDTGDFWHRTLIDPTFLRVVGDARGLRVLDLACGNGYLSRRFARAGAKVVAIEAANAVEVLGANTIAEMMDLDRELRLEAARKLMAQGVTIFRPETVVIDANVEVGADTVIEPFVQLLGTTKIGEDCRVRSYSVIENSTLANKILVRQGCVINDSQIGEGALIGPYAHIRPESEIGDGAHIGNFVETKGTEIGNKSKANHLSYLGDTTIGSGVNIGAGTIVCNYDGANKYRTVIEDGAFIGSDTQLVAPVTIGRGATIGAGSTITRDAPAEALTLSRSKQTSIAGWKRPVKKNTK